MQVGKKKITILDRYLALASITVGPSRVINFPRFGTGACAPTVSR